MPVKNIKTIRRTTFVLDRPYDQVPLTEETRLATSVDEAYDFNDPAHRKELLIRIAGELYSANKYDPETFEQLKSELEEAILEVKDAYPFQ